MHNRVLYQMDVEDVQKVAREELGRELSTAEMSQFENEIAERVPSYDIISEWISDRTTESSNDEEADE